MPNSLCKTFHTIASETSQLLATARKVKYQPSEETFTDINILRLISLHPTEIYCKTFNKHEERRNGADWEWWLSNEKQDKWLGLRVQAKILNLEKNSFLQLDYQPKNSDKSQRQILEEQARTENLIPLYCLYMHIPMPDTCYEQECRSRSNRPELYGCSLMSLNSSVHFQAINILSEGHISAAIRCSTPWHNLICPSEVCTTDLPATAWNTIQNLPNDTENEKPKVQDITSAPFRTEPPKYIQSLLNGHLTEKKGDDNLAGIVVINPSQEKLK